METRIERIRKDICSISRFNSTPHKGCTRFSYSEEDRKAKNYLLEEFNRLGLKVSTDAVGNVRARLEGEDAYAPAVVTGSHIDTVLHGGKYDGVVGVVGALEVVRTIVENGLKVNNPVEIIVFAEEEGSNFGVTTVGSQALIGKYKLEQIKKMKSADGISLYEKTKAFGLRPDDLDKSVIKPGEIKAMIELHIEQGMQLEAAGVPIGIVTAITGIRSLKVEFTGVSNHAGSTPMHLRNDPLVGAAKLIIAVEDIAKHRAFSSTVGTVGRVICFPNIPNIIPGRVVCTIDLRDVNTDGITVAFEVIKETVQQIAQEQGVEAHLEVLGDVDRVGLSEQISGLIEEAALNRNISYMKMHSGAVHDSCLLASITEVGMIFVPSKGGKSHVPVEHTDMEDIKLGCDLLLDTVIRLAT